VFVHVPGSRIDTLTMLDAVLGRPDNLSEWETLLDEWGFDPHEELPFPLSQQRRQQIRAMAGEIALIRAHHLIRKHFKGSLEDLQDTLRSLADLVFDIEKHEILANLDEAEHIRRLEAMRANIAKGTRIADANKQFFDESAAESEQAQPNPAERGANRKRSNQSKEPSSEVLQKSATMLPMASAAEFSFSDLLQQPTRVASLVEERGRIVLHRRNAPDLVLSRASDLSELAGFARLLAQMVKHLPAGDLANTVGEALPWTSYLSEEGRKEFVTELPAVIQDCEDLGTFAPLETFIASWRSTAAVMADPELADRLSRPVTKPLGTRVPAP
jgi:hypothetical protein